MTNTTASPRPTSAGAPPPLEALTALASQIKDLEATRADTRAEQLPHIRTALVHGSSAGAAATAAGISRTYLYKAGLADVVKADPFSPEERAHALEELQRLRARLNEVESDLVVKIEERIQLIRATAGSAPGPTIAEAAGVTEEWVRRISKKPKEKTA